MKLSAPLLLLLAQTAAKPDSNLPYEEEIHSLNVSQACSAASYMNHAYVSYLFTILSFLCDFALLS
jgi:hypothetical protein